MTATMFLLGLLYVVFIGVLIAIGLSAAFVVVFAVGLLFAQWYFSDTIALHAMGAHEVTPSRLHSCTGSSTVCARWPRCPSRAWPLPTSTCRTPSPPVAVRTGPWSA